LSAAKPGAVECGDRRTIHDAAGGQQLPGKVMRREGAKSRGDTAVDDAYASLGATFDFYLANHERNELPSGYRAPTVAGDNIPLEVCDETDSEGGVLTFHRILGLNHPGFTFVQPGLRVNGRALRSRRGGRHSVRF
jgi:hypothetical protein